MSTAATPSKPSWTKPVLWLLVRTFGVLAGVVTVFVVTGGGAGASAFALLVILAAILFPSRIWRPEKRDEVQQHAERFGLQVGGVAGLLLAFVTGRFFDALGFWRWANGPTQLNEGWGPEMDVFFTGMLHVTVCVVLSSCLFRIGWWIAKP